MNCVFRAVVKAAKANQPCTMGYPRDGNESVPVIPQSYTSWRTEDNQSQKTRSLLREIKYIGWS